MAAVEVSGTGVSHNDTSATLTLAFAVRALCLAATFALAGCV
jgi:hypothetical protein